MSARSIRRAAERKAMKLARKAGVSPQPQPVETTNTPETIDLIAAAANIPVPPSLARMTANRLNAQSSTGPTSLSGLAISSQNRTTHGLARHQNGTFKLLTSEDAVTFEALKQSLADEHQPATDTEAILVNTMAESHWLVGRAQRLQDTCMDPGTGVITNEKMFSLYLRYQTTHTRAFHKCFNDLLKLRAEKRKAEIGFEAQRVNNEKHEMKKASQYWDLLKKDFEVHAQVSKHILENFQAKRENPDFEAQFAAELEKRGMATREDNLPISTAA